MFFTYLLVGFVTYFMKNNLNNRNTKVMIYYKEPEVEKEKIYFRKFKTELNDKNNGTDERFGGENQTIIQTELNQLYMNFLKKELLDLLQNPRIIEYEKIKTIENYQKKYGQHSYVNNLLKGLSINDF